MADGGEDHSLQTGTITHGNHYLLVLEGRFSTRAPYNQQQEDGRETEFEVTNRKGDGTSRSCGNHCVSPMNHAVLLRPAMYRIEFKSAAPRPN